MNEGRIVQIGNPIDVYERPNSMFVADFLGDSQFVPVQAMGADHVSLGDTRLQLGRPVPSTSAKLYLLLRPEKLEVLSSPGAEPELNRLSCCLREILYQGEQVMLAVELDTGQTITVRRGTGEAMMRKLPNVGERLTIGLHPKDTLVIPGA